jgi:hypothetical protein
VRHRKKWLKAGGLEEGQWHEPAEGTPPGGHVSPLAAHRSLHYVLDGWAERWRRRLFDVVDPHEPDDWVTEVGEDGERYAYPPPLNTCGFFEDFFDAQPDAVTTFWQVVNQRLATVRVSTSASG